MFVWKNCYILTSHSSGTMTPFREDSRILGGKGPWNFVSKYGRSKTKKFWPTWKLQIWSYYRMNTTIYFQSIDVIPTDITSKMYDSHHICLNLDSFSQQQANIFFGLWKRHHVYITWLFFKPISTHCWSNSCSYQATYASI